VLGIPLQLLRDMNPQYRTDIIPVSTRPMPLRLPLEQTAKFIDFEKDIYAYKDSVYFNQDKIITTPTSYDSRGFDEPPPGNYAKLLYTVKEGDNLGYISMWYNTRISDIRYWNNIRYNTIRSGQKLTIYVPRSSLSKYQDINNLSFNEKQARIGKTVSSPSEKPGQKVIPGQEYVVYTVKQGDTIWDIMKKYPGVTEADIKNLNNISDVSKIKPGQELKIKPKS
jgi:membrane-bound lytic murein transglycosylase D